MEAMKNYFLQITMQNKQFTNICDLFYLRDLSLNFFS